MRKRNAVFGFFLAAAAGAGLATLGAGDRTSAAPAAVAPGAPPFTSKGTNVFVELSKKVVPSVVNISTVSRVKGAYSQRNPNDMFRKFFEDYFRQFGGRPPGGDEDSEEGEEPPSNRKGGGPPTYSLGSGFIIDASGLILTNNHVVAEADEIKIHFTEDALEEPADGEVVGRDHELDMALIKVKTKRPLVPLPFGDSDTLEVGEYVIAVGNPFGQGHSVTHGIISAKGRDAPGLGLASYLQTDAPINPGNSGGPLVNLKGEVIGVNNAIDQRAQGIGFAIPANLVKDVLPQLKSKGSVARGYIGVVVNELTPGVAQKTGLPKSLRAPIVTQVNEGEPAAKAGVKPYDAIVEFNGKRIRTSRELISAVTATPVGQTVPIKVNRGGSEKTLQLLVAQRPGASTLAAGKPDPKASKKPASRIATGMELEELTPEIARDLGISEKSKVKGVVVSSLEYDSPAANAGLNRGDLIIEVNQKPVTTVDEFYAVVKAKESYLLRVRRGDPSGRDIYSIVELDLKTPAGKK